jgi:hypothetical protein
MSVKKQTDIRKSIKSGVRFVVGQQRRDGGFGGWSSSSLTHFGEEREYLSTFMTAQVLEALNRVRGARGVCRRAVKFLVNQRSEQWSFNYWAKSAPE